MTTFKNTPGWLRAIALGSALLIGAATVAGPAAADELASNSPCLDGASIGFVAVNEQAGTGFAITDEQGSVIGLTALDDQASINGSNDLDSAAVSGTFTQLDESASACGN